MKAAVYYSNNDIRIEERPKPVIKDGEILVKVIASGICGTDLMEWYRIKKAPRILGHEIAGEVIESKSEKFHVGQRVFASHHVPCNNCKYCNSQNHTACETLHRGNYEPGGFSEFVRVPKINVDFGTYELPKNIDYEEGTMIEPLACVIRGQRVIGVKEGDIVLVLGSGISGLMNIAIAKLIGANVIATDIEDYRLRKAKEYGADEVIDAKKDFNAKADKVIVCTGAVKAVEQAFNSVDRKGTILLFAISGEKMEIPAVDVWRNEITITSSYGAAPIDLEEAIELIKEKKIDVKSMITDRVSLDDIQKGFEIVAKAKNSLKVVVNP